jgi:hypothetical protein
VDGDYAVPVEIRASLSKDDSRGRHLVAPAKTLGSTAPSASRSACRISGEGAQHAGQGGAACLAARKSRGVFLAEKAKFIEQI